MRQNLQQHGIFHLLFIGLRCYHLASWVSFKNSFKNPATLPARPHFSTFFDPFVLYTRHGIGYFYLKLTGDFIKAINHAITLIISIRKEKAYKSLQTTFASFSI